MKQPKYIEIYQDISKCIKKGKYKVGDELPYDKEFCVRYEVSIITVKKAMQLLVEENYISRKSGKRTTVTYIKSQSEKMILSLIVPNFTEAFCYEIVEQFERFCRKAGYIPLISRSYENQDMESQIIDEHISLKTLGIIIMPILCEYYNAELLRLSYEDFPIVALDREMKQLPISSVITDNYAGGKKLGEYLINKWKKKVIIVTASHGKSSPIAQRIKGVTEVLSERNCVYSTIFFDEHSPLHERNNEYDSYHLQSEIDRLVAIGYDSVFCVQYEIALDVYHYTQPKHRVEVVCFDYPSNRAKVRFTHIKQNEKEIANNALSIIQSSINGNHFIERKKVEGILVNNNEL